MFLNKSLGNSPLPPVKMCEQVTLCTFSAAPGLVTNLTAYAYNHTFVVVKWYLPHRINGLITKFGVRAKHARTGKIVRMLEVNAEDIMNGVLPHCNVPHHYVVCAELFVCVKYLLFILNMFNMSRMQLISFPKQLPAPWR